MNQCRHCQQPIPLHWRYCDREECVYLERRRFYKPPPKGNHLERMKRRIEERDKKKGRTSPSFILKERKENAERLGMDLNNYLKVFTAIPPPPKPERSWVCDCKEGYIWPSKKSWCSLCGKTRPVDRRYG